MRASAYVGRVGGLAVALGIGVAVTVGVAATASASPVDSRPPSGGDAAATDPSTAWRSSERTRGGHSASAPTGSNSRPTASGSSATRSIVVPTPAAALGPANDANAATQPPPLSSAASRLFAGADRINLPTVAIPAAPTAESVVVQSVTAAPNVAPLVAAVPLTDPAMTATPAVPPGGMDSVPSPLLGTNPLAPAQSPVTWVVVAAARRERGGSPAADVTPITLITNSDVAEEKPAPQAVEPTGTGARLAAAAAAASTGLAQAVTPVAAVTAADPITAFIGQIQAFVTQIVQAVTQVITQVLAAITNMFSPVPPNNAPTVSTPTVGSPDAATGVVSGVVSAIDADGDTITYSAPASTAKGAVVMDAATGEFTYTPTLSARYVAAALNATDAEKVDTFTVTVTDERGGKATIAVAVAISPVKAVPVAGTPRIGIPNASTGVVTGSVSASDPNGDALTYHAPTATAKGTVVIDAATGEFVYTPTADARHAAASLTATDAQKVDTFTVTVADGNGGTATTVVNVVISPLNAAPVAGSPTVGSPDATTGRVIGQINATDPDGDPFTYSGSTTTSSGGTLVVNPDGSFVYTPSAGVWASVGGYSRNSVQLKYDLHYYPGYRNPPVLSPDGTRLYVAYSGTWYGDENFVVAFNTADNSSSRFSTASGSAFGPMAISPNGSRLYVTEIITSGDLYNQVRTGRIAVVDTATGTAVGTVEGFGGSVRNIAFAPNGNRAYAIDDDGSMKVIDTAVSRIVANITGPFGSSNIWTSKWSMAVSPDGRYVYATSADSISVIDTTTNSVIRSIPVSGWGGIALSPDGSRLYTVNTGTPLYSSSTMSIVDTATGSVVSSLLLKSALVDQMEVSPDGSRLFLVDKANNVVAVIDTKSSSLQTTLQKWEYDYSSKGYPYQVAVASDGRVFVTGLGYDINVWNRNLYATDYFSVVASDGFGGTTTIPVTVAISR